MIGECAYNECDTTYTQHPDKRASVRIVDERRIAAFVFTCTRCCEDVWLFGIDFDVRRAIEWPGSGDECSETHIFYIKLPNQEEIEGWILLLVNV